MKTKQEIEELKRQWQRDPCWDLYDTEGFEDHTEELATFQSEKEKEWNDNKNKKIFNCATCGYTWGEGSSGEHSCTENLRVRLKKAERDWLIEHRIIELLLVGEFVTRDKVKQARDILVDMP